MAEFNAEQLDVLGTSTIKAKFTFLKYCRPYINDGDKKPIWDGELFVYKHPTDFKKDNLDFTLPLQVKTSFHDKKALPKKSKYSVSVSDLKQYLKDGGILFLNVLVNQLGDTQIYCGFLNKAELKKYIAKAKDHATIVIGFERMPKTFKAFYDEVYTLYLQKRYNCISIEQLNSIKNPKLTFRLNHIPKGEDVPMHIASHPVDILVEAEGFDEPLYLGEGRSFLKVESTTDTIISVDGVVYYNQVTRFPEGKSYIIRIGRSVQLRITPNESEELIGTNQLEVNFTIPKDVTLTELIHELRFVTSTLKSGSIYFDGKPLEFPSLNADILKARDIWQSHLKFWEESEQVLKLLHVEEPLDMATVDEDAEKNLRLLIDSFLYGKRVVGDGTCNNGHTTIIEIGNISILLFAEHLEGKYFKFKDIFDGLIMTDGKDGGYRPLSPFIVPYMKHWERVPDNIPVSQIEESYSQILSQHPSVKHDAVENMLCMITAFDNTSRLVHLKGAEVLCQWLLKQPAEDGMMVRNRLNYYQILLRQRPLEESELEQLVDIADESTEADVRIAAHALIGNDSTVRRLWNKMVPQSKEDLSHRPIYKFIQRYINQ